MTRQPLSKQVTKGRVGKTFEDSSDFLADESFPVTTPQNIANAITTLIQRAS